MFALLTKQQHAGVGCSQTVGGEASVVSKMLLCYVGKQQQRARLFVFDPQGVVTLYWPVHERVGRRRACYRKGDMTQHNIMPRVCKKKTSSPVYVSGWSHPLYVHLS